MMMIIAWMMMVTVKQWWWCTVDTLVTTHPKRTLSPVTMIAMTMILVTNMMIQMILSQHHHHHRWWDDSDDDDVFSAQFKREKWKGKSCSHTEKPAKAFTKLLQAKMEEVSLTSSSSHHHGLFSHRFQELKSFENLHIVQFLFSFDKLETEDHQGRLGWCGTDAFTTYIRTTPSSTLSWKTMKIFKSMNKRFPPE